MLVNLVAANDGTIAASPDSLGDQQQPLMDSSSQPRHEGKEPADQSTDTLTEQKSSLNQELRDPQLDGLAQPACQTTVAGDQPAEVQMARTPVAQQTQQTLCALQPAADRERPQTGVQTAQATRQREASTSPAAAAPFAEEHTALADSPLSVMTDPSRMKVLLLDFLAVLFVCFVSNFATIPFTCCCSSMQAALMAFSYCHSGWL